MALTTSSVTLCTTPGSGFASLHWTLTLLTNQVEQSTAASPGREPGAEDGLRGRRVEGRLGPACVFSVGMLSVRADGGQAPAKSAAR